MITVQNLSKSYAQHQSLIDINVSFPSRALTSLIGANGAGKSTLLTIMARWLDYDTGSILLNGRNIHEIPIAEYAKQVATLGQSPNFNLRLTVEELVAFGRFPHNRGRLRLEDKQIIDDAIDFLGLDSLRHCYLDQLSGGQRQMAFLAMVIAQQTDILLLDEPLNNLDMKHAVQLMRALRRLCDEQGRTVIVVIHDINFAANYSDHIVALKQGQVCFSGSVEQSINEEKLQDLYDLKFVIQKDEQGCICNYFNPTEELK
ncbi:MULTISPECIES: ABC transporter ATP-binding protein [Acinetobacter]|uniref:Iron ABC transporter ATP-binding protein n=1 Tax=Acinetobacter soli TaxID=487316 RepID=A0A1P8EKS7_9GAMM|nr:MULTISPECIES: ATP-binding cassette domain-containing protein [Acinetobacter]APV36826.1 iron ABC transporter ATP-binding protein [Acinetobacter soli]AVP33398.1 putative siderophore transport system ATP-binding protein YusV [Acinetobacter baumannii]MDI9723916.1 ATP-binding cassette domain-containing protein [Acinetobacter baumannii]MDQ8999630.1 ATP-binding cassette domain-containing protein [Acinetobacter baumannii]MDQ9003069.1 ATP-binding cassette domain-containing protein [Acinetobacter bau